ncbi:phage protease [Sphingopyxis granuli]|uniref:phage protease n=1 Tax=Sphingopyxis granuli TaxID=267128 RepID=UPI001BB0656F|nr:phage protease [Sphingopyxis granuli]QUM72190.1 hypothetical protein ICN83_18165 [Sphingopyxis granuli]
MAKGKKLRVDQLAVGDAFAIASTEGQPVTPPAVIQLFKMGAHPSRNGKPAIVRVDDLAHAQRIASATAAYHRTNEMVIDYDHQSVFGAKNGVGGKAPASGWSPNVFATEDGVFAKVDWTAAGAAAIVAKEYRYISPVFAHDKAGRPIFVVNATLTNTPSLDLDAVATAFASLDAEAAALAFASAQSGEDSVNLTSIAKALGLGEDATEEEVLRAIANLSGAATMTAIATALGAAEGDDLVAAATALKEKADNAGNPDPAKFVPVETVAALQTSVQSLTGTVNQLQGDQRKAKIDQAQADGRLVPALVAYASSIADDAKLDEFLAALPTTGLGKPAISDPATLNAEGKLTEEQIALCSSMGWDTEAYLAQLKKEAE